MKDSTITNMKKAYSVPLIQDIINKTFSKIVKYELINPSDKIFFESDDFETAAYATILIGRGAYGASPVDINGEEIPVFLLGGAKEWIEKRFNTTLDRWITKYDLKDNRVKLVKVLKSFKLSGNRTSLNNICKKVHEYAKKLEDLND